MQADGHRFRSFPAALSAGEEKTMAVFRFAGLPFLFRFTTGGKRFIIISKK
jgi:hypothetical protein